MIIKGLRAGEQHGMRVIVTGSSGLLGRHTVAALEAAGHEVTGARLGSQPQAAHRHISADLTDLATALRLIRDADAVIHAAAIPRPTGYAAADVFTTNVTSTYNVVEAAVQNRIPRLVYASSYSVIGPPFNVAPVRLRFPSTPIIRRHPRTSMRSPSGSARRSSRRRSAAGSSRAISVRLSWIQTPESFRGDIAPRRTDPAFGAQNLWTYVDGRDAGAALCAALGAEVQGHRVLYLSAADSFMEEETATLIRAAYPDAAITRPLIGTQSVFDLSDAEAVLGFVPKHSWRDY